MKEAYYFSHDSNSRNDSKIINLRMKHGMRGYGIYWAIIEMLRDESEYTMQLQYERIAFELHDDCETIKSVVEDFGLFKIKEDKFWSESLLRRMKIREEKSDKARKSALKRWKADNESESDANALQLQYVSNAIKGKERKGNENKEKESVKFPDDSDEIQVLTKKVSEYFSISEMYHPAHFMKIGNFCRYMEMSGKMEYFKKQFSCYCDFKNKNGYKHSWGKYIGSPEKSYEDGAWNEKDWSKEGNIMSNILPMSKRTNRNPQ